MNLTQWDSIWVTRKGSYRVRGLSILRRNSIVLLFYHWILNSSRGRINVCYQRDELTSGFSPSCVWLFQLRASHTLIALHADSQITLLRALTNSSL